MRRLNVREAQIDECIQNSVFAIGFRPQHPALQPGELLLLQLVKKEAQRLGKLKSRVNFALVFERLEQDYDGTISRLYWPDEGRVWPWIVYGQATVPTVPFSLEGLSLSKSYEGRFNPGYIEKQDEEIILPYIQWDLAELPAPALQLVPASQVAQKFGRTRALSAIYNHDRIAVLRPVPKILTSTEVFVRNQWLSESLKAYYDCRCTAYPWPIPTILSTSPRAVRMSAEISWWCARTITACFTQRMPASTVSISRMSIQTACASR